MAQNFLMDDLTYQTWGASYMTTDTVVSDKNTTLDLCRKCAHVHVAGGQGCLVVQGNMACFTSCNCDEYVPTDNLRYLEYMANKK